MRRNTALRNPALRIAAPVAALCLVGRGVTARAAPSLQTLALTVDGASRSALVYVPPAGTPGPLPLVFAFHGHGGTARSAERGFRTDRLWPEAISVYPQGLDTPGQLLDPDGQASGWQSGPGRQGDRDLHLFDALLAKLGADHPVDPRRVYCTGHSNGGGFTYLLWRTRGDRLAAVAPSSAAAVAYAGQLPPKPALILGGRDDPIVKFAWQQRTIDLVRRADGCDATPVPWGPGGELYPSAGGTPLATYVHPGGHPMDAAEPGLIVTFFKQHPGPTTRP